MRLWMSIGGSWSSTRLRPWTTRTGTWHLTTRTRNGSISIGLMCLRLSGRSHSSADSPSAARGRSCTRWLWGCCRETQSSSLSRTRSTWWLVDPSWWRTTKETLRFHRRLPSLGRAISLTFIKRGQRSSTVWRPGSSARLTRRLQYSRRITLRTSGKTSSSRMPRVLGPKSTDSSRRMC